MSGYRPSYRRSRTRKRSRTIPIPGNPYRGAESADAVGEDHGKYYRCWHCGFICDSERDSLGGPEDIPDITPTTYTQTDEYGTETYHCQGAAGDTEAVCEAAGGTWSSTRYEAGGSGGCPRCHTLNWRGDY